MSTSWLSEHALEPNPDMTSRTSTFRRERATVAVEGKSKPSLTAMLAARREQRRAERNEPTG